jgi:hypothetical protein
LASTDLDDLAIEQVPWWDQAWLGMAPMSATAAALVDPAEDLPEGDRIGFPAIVQPHRQATQARHYLRDQQGSALLGARAPVHPQHEPAAHGEGRVQPLDMESTPFGCISSV